MQHPEDIHWHEGLFLQPHHLQIMQHTMLERIGSERSLGFPYPYGLLDADLSTDALNNYIVEFSRLHAVMPSGLEVKVPDNADLPRLNIKEAFERRREPMMVYLAVPTWSENEANTNEYGDDNAATTRRYTVRERMWRDENTGDSPQPVLMRRINARLVLDKEDHSNLEIMPVLRVIPSATEDASSMPQWDRRHVPPCLALKGSDTLTRILLDLLNQMVSRRQEIVNEIKRAGYNPETLSGIQLDRVLRLQTINRHTARLGCLIDLPSVTPLQMYLELRDLLCDLAALDPSRDLFWVPNYEHENCRPQFQELIVRIRNLLLPGGAGTYVKVPFKRLDDRCWQAELTEEHLLKAEDYFLSVETREEPRKVVTTLESGDQFKLIAASMRSARVRGIRLQEERYPPRILPANANVMWFRLNRAESARSWNQIRDERKMAAVWSSDLLADMAISLYITLMEPKGAK